MIRSFINFEIGRKIPNYTDVAAALVGGLVRGGIFRDDNGLVNLITRSEEPRVSSVNTSFQPMRELSAYANEAAATAGGVPIGGLYHLTGSGIVTVNTSVTASTRVPYVGFKPSKVPGTYANNAAAITGGVAVGEVFINSSFTKALAVVV